jgi:hypothetical protein
MSYNIEVEGGKSVRLKTAGKYCDRDIVVTAKGGSTGENKWVQLVDRSIAEITAEDLAGITTIGSYAFSSCPKLKSVDFTEAIESIGQYAFSSCYGMDHGVVIHGNTKTIAVYAFYNCQKVPYLVLEEGIEKIGACAFQIWYGLKELHIPNSVREIESQAFKSCKNLGKLTIGAGVTKIGSGAFADETALSRVTILAETPPSIQNNTFQNCTALEQIIVPIGCADAYKAATNWSAYADIIVEEGAE